jgi:putative intracellular protease/amidase
MGSRQNSCLVQDPKPPCRTGQSRASSPREQRQHSTQPCCKRHPCSVPAAAAARLCTSFSKHTHSQNTANMTFVASASLADSTPGGPSQPPQQPLDWLLVPGGIGTRQEVSNTALLDFIRACCDPAAGLSLVMSVCTGSALLAAAGVLDGRCVNCHIWARAANTSCLTAVCLSS